MKLLVLASIALISGIGTANAQEFTFLSGFDRNTFVTWSIENGEERRVDINPILGTCERPDGSQASRFFQRVSSDSSTGLVYGVSTVCGGSSQDFLIVDTLTGDVTLMPDLEGQLGLEQFAIGQSFLSFSGPMPLRSGALSREIESSSAVASALEIQLPVDGSTNRVGLTSGAFGNEQAFGVSYARVQGSFDVGFAYAQGDGGRNAGKVSVGFSW